MNGKSLYIALISLIILSGVCSAQDSTQIFKQNYRVSIEKKELFLDFKKDTINIYLNSYEQPLKGFALKFGVQTQFFNIDEIIPGDFYYNCGWEFYNDKQVISDFSAENYLQVWQVIGLSEIFADSITPTCLATQTNQSLAKIVISRNPFTETSDSTIPLFFIWENCSDNTLSGLSGNDLFVSDKIFEYDTNQPQFEKNKFPTTFGIPETCTSRASLNAPVKGITFYNGGVILKDINIDDSLILNK